MEMEAGAAGPGWMCRRRRSSCCCVFITEIMYQKSNRRGNYKVEDSITNSSLIVASVTVDTEMQNAYFGVSIKLTWLTVLRVSFGSGESCNI